MIPCTLNTMLEASPYSKIYKNIYVGSVKSLDFAQNFDVVIIAAKEIICPKKFSAEIINVPLDDAPWNFRSRMHEFYALYNIADYIADKIAHGKKVLFVCHMGMNRSALMAGLTMTHLGFKEDQIIALLKTRNPCVLMNESFAAAIRHACSIR